MKKILIAITIAISPSINAQTGELLIDETGDSTVMGTPDGIRTSQEIGEAGGKIKSEDGKVELIFPPGALAATTMISIQPTTNPSPHGTGKAYWFEPSGIQFKKPVQIIFQYTEEESRSCHPELMNLGIQDKNGKWTFVEYEEWDSVNSKLKGSIHHFSGASNIKTVYLQVEKKIVPVTGNTLIWLVDKSESWDLENAIISQNYTVLWYVNDNFLGDEELGIIEPSEQPWPGKNKFVGAKYFAPNILDEFLVWVAAEFYVKSKKGYVRKRRTSSIINLYDMYRVRVIHEFEGRVDNGSKLIDSASFLVNVPDYEVSDIKNHRPIVLKEGTKAGIREKIFTDGADGPIHIVQEKQENTISKDSPYEIYFRFKSIPVLNHTVQYVARGIPTAKVPLEDGSIPVEINFIANGEPQVINVQDAGNKYKVIVKREITKK